MTSTLLDTSQLATTGFLYIRPIKMDSIVDDPFAVLGNADARELARYAWSDNINLGISQPEDLVLQGDLLIAVGPNRRLFTMTSSFLTEISHVFAVMLGPHFEEGHRLRSLQPGDPEMVLELPDDDAQAFHNTVRVLYGADPATKDYEPAEIQKIAVIVDKYDMVSRFTFASAYWFAKYTWADDPEETWQLTTAAYWLQCPDAFFLFSKKLIKQLQASHLEYIDQMPDRVLGLRLCYVSLESPALQQRRQSVIVTTTVTANDWRSLTTLCSTYLSKPCNMPDVLPRFFVFLHRHISTQHPHSQALSKMSASSPASPDRDSGKNELPGLVKICPKGDVILVVDPDKKKMRVTPDFLGHISPVFRDMVEANPLEEESHQNRVDEVVVGLALRR
ncbi:hypothetical protein F66182_5468 [Fusarium sp. NRRL 66182]|nr:hypothetical protein F66182_5468 [Fusarium sp. NRRL 66182]